jgi:hypothetical protein
MNKIIPIAATKITPLIHLSSRALITDTAAPFDKHFRFETSLCSMDDRFESHTYTWGRSTEFFQSFHLFRFTSWIHKRIRKNFRSRLKKAAV